MVAGVQILLIMWVRKAIGQVLIAASSIQLIKIPTHFTLSFLLDDVLLIGFDMMMMGSSGLNRFDLWAFNINDMSWVELTQNITGNGVIASSSDYQSSGGHALSDGDLILFGGRAGNFQS